MTIMRTILLSFTVGLITAVITQVVFNNNKTQYVAIVRGNDKATFKAVCNDHNMKLDYWSADQVYGRNRKSTFVINRSEKSSISFYFTCEEK